MDLMDEAMTGMLEDRMGDYSLKFCKYSLFHVVKALAYLHSQNII